MPFVLKNTRTDEIFACPLINNYGFPFYGVKFWEAIEEAEAEKEQYRMNLESDQGEIWILYEVEERILKLMNVRLQNHPKNRVFLDSAGRITVKN